MIESAVAQNGSARLGRPRDEQARQAILDAALTLVSEVGFRALGVEAIAAKASVAKATVYRWWPNKAAVVMDAFMEDISPSIAFHRMSSISESIRHQMGSLAKAFRGQSGVLISALLAEVQFDSELAKAFRERWTFPRRQIARKLFEEGKRNGEFRADIDIEVAIDALYGPFYYRLMIGNAPLSDAYVDELFQQVLDGLVKNPLA